LITLVRTIRECASGKIFCSKGDNYKDVIFVSRFELLQTVIYSMCSDKEKLEIVEDKLHGEYFILTKGKGSFLSFIYLRNIINFEQVMQYRYNLFKD
jgi:hypothetical protein